MQKLLSDFSYIAISQIAVDPFCEARICQKGPIIKEIRLLNRESTHKVQFMTQRKLLLQYPPKNAFNWKAIIYVVGYQFGGYHKS